LWLSLRLNLQLCRGWARRALFLQAPQIRFELLVAVQLLDRAGELPDLRFETVEPRCQLAGPLRDAILRPGLCLHPALWRRDRSCSGDSRWLPPKMSLRKLPCANAAEGTASSLRRLQR
jgi:hypothetical protein